MTNAQVEKLIQEAAARGRVIDRYDASVYLQACEILSRESSNADAREVVANFQKFLSTGIEETSFAEFVLPTPYTDEALAAQKRSRDEYLARVNKETIP